MARHRFPRGFLNPMKLPWCRTKLSTSVRFALARRRAVALKQGVVPKGEDEHGRLTAQGKEALRLYNILSISKLAKAMGWSYGSTWRFVQRHGGTKADADKMDTARRRALELREHGRSIRQTALVMGWEYGWSYTKTWRFVTLKEREQRMLGDIDAFLGEGVASDGQVEA